MGGRKAIDIEGRRFGRLLVLKRLPRSEIPKGEVQWHCVCDCGNRIIALSHNLRDGNTKSCGCLNDDKRRSRALDLEGKRSGRLVALSIAPTPRGHNKWWLCRCDCGNTKVVRGDRFARQETISCGCAVSLGKPVIRPLAIRQESATKTKRAKGRATPEEIADLLVKQHSCCANCTTPITLETCHRDHIIPVSRGGLNVIANIQLLCIPCNRRKYNKMPWEFALEQGRLV